MTPQLQDAGVRHIDADLATVLTLLRALAGHRGDARVGWHGQGFTYHLLVVRDPHGDPSVDIDEDTTGEGLGAQDTSALRARLVELLAVQP